MSLRVEELCLRFVPMPRRRNIFRLKPPSSRRGIRCDSMIRMMTAKEYVEVRRAKGQNAPSP
jgi:hypothetical protein